MSRDKTKDDLIFNCNQAIEIAYLEGLYKNRATVKLFLKNKRESHQLFYSTHKEVYEIIKKELNLEIPN